MGVESTYRDHPYGSIFKTTTDGTSSGGGGGATPGVAIFSINQYNTSGTGPTETPYPGASPGTEYKFASAGYYVVTIPDASDPLTFDMWAWGAGGGPGAGPGPGYGGAGGGVRGRYTFTAPGTFTFLVGSTASSGTGGWPDGGNSPPSDGYVEGGGGGRSSIGEGTIAFAARDSSTTAYLLIGGGGGGGTSYSTSGPGAGQGGYPSGTAGGWYYPAEGSGCLGGGGTQSAGGAAGGAGRTPAGTAGGKYSGGPGPGGAGGGGYYGGGGAGGYYAQGGGGSGYIDPTITNSDSFDASPGTNHYVAADDPGNSTIKPANAGDMGYAGFVALKLVAHG